MKDLNVSAFKAKIAACLRDVQDGETYVITDHKRPIAEVRGIGSDLVSPASRPFTLKDSKPDGEITVSWESLLDAERGGH